MKVNRLASVLMRGTFLMDPRYAFGYIPRVARYLNGEKVSWYDDDEKEDDPYIGACFVGVDGRINRIQKSETGNIFSSAPQGSVAIIPVQGVIMRADNCGDPGTDTMSTWIKDAKEAENISSIILRINSGGGTVDGTGEFSSIVSEVNQVKPVIAYVENLIASAAYWIGSSAREIYVSHETVEVGSIGTCISFYDNRDALKEWGYTKHYINADSSPDKNDDFQKALDGDYTQLKVNILNPTNDIFLSAVKKNRAGSLVLTEVEIKGEKYFEPLTGKIYLAQKAIENGLITGIKTFDLAVEHAISLSKLNPKLKKSNMENENLLALANTETPDEATIEAANGDLRNAGITTVILVESSFLEQAAAATEQLATATTDLETVNTALQTATDNLASAKTDLETANTSLKAANDRVAELEAKLPGGAGKKPVLSKISTTAPKAEGEMTDLDQKAARLSAINEKKANMNFSLE